MLERLDLTNVSASAIAPTSGIAADTKRKRARCTRARRSAMRSAKSRPLPAPWPSAD